MTFVSRFISRYDILVSHDRNPIIITRVCVKDVKLAAYTADQSFDWIFCFTESLEEKSEDFFPQEVKEPGRREKLRHALFRGSKVPAPISSCRLPLFPPIPWHCRYRLPLRSRASTWAKGIKKIHQEREDLRDLSPFSANTLDARAKGVEE